LGKQAFSGLSRECLLQEENKLDFWYLVLVKGIVMERALLKSLLVLADIVEARDPWYADPLWSTTNVRMGRAIHPV
jgi:hypothetical protein